MSDDVLVDVSWEVHYDVQPHGQDKWASSKSAPLPTEAVALEMFENYFNKPYYRNVEVVKVVRSVIWQRKKYGAATTIISTE